MFVGIVFPLFSRSSAFQKSTFAQELIVIPPDGIISVYKFKGDAFVIL